MSRYISLAFTGYRTEKLPFPLTDENSAELRRRIAEVIREEAERGVKYFMSGVCHGLDLIAAEAVMELKKELGIELWCAIPFEGHRRTVPQSELSRYDRVLKEANGCVILGKNADHTDYARLYNERNYYMINKCDGLIAVCERYAIRPGGTKNTVEMAKKLNKKIIYVYTDGIGEKNA